MILSRVGVSARGRSRIVVLLLGCLTGIFSASSVLAQCAMCTASVEATDSGAFNLSTYLLLAVPYLIVFGVAGYVAYAFRVSRSPRAAGEGKPSSPEPAS